MARSKLWRNPIQPPFSSSPHPSQQERFAQFASLLLEWNAIHNISGFRTPNIIEENLRDCLEPLTFLPELKNLSSALDVGSGAGFPGIALAIALPQCIFVLCEPMQKRAAFLHLAKAELGLCNVEVATKRVEQLSYPPFAMITSRAVLNTKTLLGLCRHLCAKETLFLLYKGEQSDSELPKQGRCEVVRYPKRSYVVMREVCDFN